MNDEFVRRLEYWCRKLGKKRFVTFIGDCVAKGLMIPEFYLQLLVWFRQLGANRFVTFISKDPLASRITNEAFKARLRIWRTEVQNDDLFTSIFSKGCFVKRVADNDEFNQKALAKLRVLGAKEFRYTAGKHEGKKLDTWISTAVV